MIIMNKPWLDHYPPGIPADINPDAYPSIPALFEEAAERFKDRPAFSHYGREMSYGELRDKAHACGVFAIQRAQEE